MTQEPDPGAERPRPADEPRPGLTQGPSGVDRSRARAMTAAIIFAGMALQFDHWSWLVVGLGVVVMMLRPQMGGGSLVLMAGLVAFIGFVHGWSWVVILIGLVVMIFLHELGHFLTARWSGMKATEFFIGFGPKLWSFTRGETEYGVKAIPAGAYVRIIGMTTAEEVPPEEEDRTYRQKSFPKRLLVVSAGSLMHLGQALVAAVVLLVFIGVPGGTLVPRDPIHHDQWVVDSRVSPGSAADSAGLVEGDRIVEWDGVSVDTFGEVRDEVIASDVGQTVTLTVERDGDELETRTELVDRLLRVRGGEEELEPGLEVLGEVEAAGSVVAWDDEKIETFGELRRQVSEVDQGDEATLTIRGAGGREFETTVRVVDPPSRQAHPNAVLAVPFLGVGPTFEEDLTEVTTLGVVGGVAQAGKDTGEVLWLTTEGLGRFLNPSNLVDYFGSALNGGSDQQSASVHSSGISPVPEEEIAAEPDRELMSIIGITRMASNLEPAGLLIAFFLVNLAIGLINMGPLLPLDGGHAVVAIYERVRSRNGQRYFADPDKLMPLAYVGLMLILAIGLTAMFLDIVDPIQL